jgi:UDP-N-acetylglucosamine:LPS N-acetylglucosamine transferase
VKRARDPLPADVHEARHVLLVSSGGGHLSQLLALQPWWGQRRRTWAVFDTPETRSRLTGEKVVFAHHPTTRNIPNLLRNTVLAAKTVPAVQPDLVVSTGAGVAVPFFIVAWAMGVPRVYIEVFDRLDSATLTGRICYPISTLFLVQWPQQRRMYPRAHLLGTLI